MNHLAMAWFLVALCALLPLRASAETTFKNATETDLHLYIKTGPGDCAEKQGQEVSALARGEGITIADRGETVCYAFSVSVAPTSSPLGGGVAQPGETIPIQDLAQPVEFQVYRRVTDLGLATSQVYATGEQVPVSNITAQVIDFDRPRIILPPLESRRPGAVPVPPAAPPLPTVDVERGLASYIDPFTPPQSATDCVQEAFGDIPFDGQWRICTGWRTRWRCMRRELFLIASGPDANTIRVGVEQCLTTAAVAGAASGLVAAFLSGGTGAPAALSAFVTTLEICLVARAGEVSSVRIDNRGGWTDWGGC